MKPLKVIFCKHVPFKGFHAITMFDYMIIRKEYENLPIEQRSYNHESIHQAQSRDFGLGFFGYFLFYPLYLLEWLIKLPWALFRYKPYRSISFEQESFANQDNMTYLDNRKRFTWLKYLFKMIK